MLTGGVTRDRFNVITDGLPSQLPDIDPEETREWIESFDAAVDSDGRQRARFLMLKLLERARERQVGVPALRSHRLHQHHPAGTRAVVSRRRGHRAPDPRLHPLERRDHGVAREQDGRRRRPHRDLRQRGLAVRGGLQPLLPRQGSRVRGRATRSTSRATPRRGSTPAHSSRAGCPRSSSTGSGRRSRAPR